MAWSFLCCAAAHAGVWPLLSLGLTAGSAAGVEAEAAGGNQEEQQPQMRNVIDVRTGYFAMIETRGVGVDAAEGVAAEISYERTLIPRWLVTEFSVPVAVTFDDDIGVNLPMSLRFKKPFRTTKRVQPYIAGGLAFSADLEPHDELWLGLSAAVGTFIWPTRHVGIDIGIDYNILEAEGPPVHQLFLGFGPAFRF